ncbi:MAG TPA: PAS domain S-box protein [Chitinispirillaceae bacterium]|nr:PAS domain S-box protein [Chitinispirillaceae bacterium]
MTGSIIILSYLLSIAGFVFDLLSPEGYTEWIFYLIPLLCISYSNKVKHLFIIAIFNNILLLSGYVLSENIPDRIVIFHRILGTGMIWTITANVYRRTRAQEWLKENQQKLKESQLDLKRAQAVAKIGSWRMDIIKNELVWSEEAYRIFNIPVHTLVNYETFLSTVHPEDREYVDRQWHAALSGAPYEIEHRIMIDKSMKWVEEKAQLEFNDAGTLTGGFGTVQDITELKYAEEALKRSEEKYRLLFTNTINGTALHEIITADDNRVKDFRFLEVNPAFEKIVGLPSDAIIGRTARQLFPGIENDPADWIGTYGQVALKDEKVQFEQFFTLLNKWFRVVAFKTKERQFCVVFDDITLQRKVFHELQESENRLKILNENLENIVVQRTRQVRILAKALTLAEQRERKRFSHILHENLQQQLLGAGLLLRQHLADHKDAGTAQGPDDIVDGLDMLDKALQTTKTLSIELNPPILSSEGLDLALEWLIKHMKLNYGLIVDFHCEAAIGLIKNDTQLMLIQMARELLYNVVEHSGVHNARLEAVCDDKQVKITVSDKGKGFDPEKVLTEDDDKVRLGLLSIRERLRLFGGDLVIKSESNKGTCSIILLPAAVCT